MHYKQHLSDIHSSRTHQELVHIQKLKRLQLNKEIPFFIAEKRFSAIKRE